MDQMDQGWLCMPEGYKWANRVEGIGLSNVYTMNFELFQCHSFFCSTHV